jgi:membrane protein YdbS with pleckstrin-like domain
MLKNDYLPFDQLPRAETLPFTRLPQAGCWREILGRLAMWLILAAGLFLLGVKHGNALAYLGPAWLWLTPILLLHLALPIMAWRYRRLAVREHDLVLQEGIFLRSMRAQPLARVQHVQLQQDLLQRWLGLASLTLYGAGKRSTRFAVPNLPLEQALQLRDHVLHHTAAPDAAPDAAPSGTHS